MAKSRRKPQRSGRISLYVPPVLHDEMAEVAEWLGLDLNGLINFMIRRSFDRYRLEAAMLKAQAKESVDLITAWREDNPGRPVREFWDDYKRCAKAKRAAASQAAKDMRARQREVFDFDAMDAAIREAARQALLHRGEE